MKGIKIRYIGQLSGVIVTPFRGLNIEFKRNEAKDVPEKQALALVKGKSFELVEESEEDTTPTPTIIDDDGEKE